MQTITEHLTQDFEVHPIGTGRELARLHDRVRHLENAISEFMHKADALFVEDEEQDAKDRARTDLGDTVVQSRG